MKLQAESGNAFELVVLRYEHPDFTEDRWDANWLVVSGTVTAAGQSWGFVEPCITTFELAELADWLENPRNGALDPTTCAFTEPNLEFSYSGQPEPRLRIRFAHASAPPWLAEPSERAGGLSLEFPLSEQDREAAVAALRHALREWPIRGGAA